KHRLACLKEVLKPLADARNDGGKLWATMVDHRSRHRFGDLGRNRRRTGDAQILLHTGKPLLVRTDSDEQPENTARRRCVPLSAMRRCIIMVWVTSCCSKDSNDPGKVSMRWEEGKRVKQLTAPQSPGRNAYLYCVYNESLRHSHCLTHRHQNDEPSREAHLPPQCRDA